MSTETTLDERAAGEAASELERSSDEVARCADRLDGRAFGPDTAGRNYRSSAADLVGGLEHLASTLRAWSQATTETSSSIRSAVAASVSTDTSTAGSLPRGVR